MLIESFNFSQVTANRVLARDSNCVMDNCHTKPCCVQLSFTEAAAVIKGEIQVRKLVFAVLRRRDRACLNFDVKSRRGVRCAAFPTCADFLPNLKDNQYKTGSCTGLHTSKLRHLLVSSLFLQLGRLSGIEFYYTGRLQNSCNRFNFWPVRFGITS